MATTPAALDTTLCALVHRPDAFDGKMVRFRAGVLTDWDQGTVLVHTGCKGGVQLHSTDAVPAEQSQALDKAVGVNDLAAANAFSARSRPARVIPQSAPMGGGGHRPLPIL